jgi:hypothetical protein
MKISIRDENVMSETASLYLKQAVNFDELQTAHQKLIDIEEAHITCAKIRFLALIRYSVMPQFFLLLLLSSVYILFNFKTANTML